MINNVKFEVSVFEILALMKRRWILICILMLALMLLCGGYKALSDKPQQQQGNSGADYTENMEVYDTFVKAQEILPDTYKIEWESTYRDRAENPVYSIDPFKCDYEQIVLRFKDNDNNHDWTVKNWISLADDQELFGDQKSTLSDYKTVLISTGRVSDTQVSRADETAVQVLSVDGFDVNKAAGYLTRHFKKCSEDDGLKIEGISRAHIKGYDETLWVYQERSRTRLISLYNAFDTSSKMDRYITEPKNTQTSGSVSKMGILKYCLMGLILGLILGGMIVVFDVIRKRAIISTRQVEEIFDLALLSDCSSGNEVSLDVLNANLDVMTEEKSVISLVSDQLVKEVEEITTRWSEKSGRTFVPCSDIFDDPKTIEALKTTDGVIIGVQLGKSKLEQLQRVLLRTEKLNLKVLGYVLL